MWVDEEKSIWEGICLDIVLKKKIKRQEEFRRQQKKKKYRHCVHLTEYKSMKRHFLFGLRKYQSVDNYSLLVVVPGSCCSCYCSEYNIVRLHNHHPNWYSYFVPSILLYIYRYILCKQSAVGKNQKIFYR